MVGLLIVRASSAQEFSLRDLRDFVAVPPGMDLAVSAVSDDGSVVGGAIGTPYQFGLGEAFVWDATNGTQLLGTLQPGVSWGARVLDLSADGSTVVGWSRTAGLDESVFVWAAASGMTEVQFPAYADFSVDVHDVSSDGTTLVGRDGNVREAFRWTLLGGFEYLGPESRAWGVSSDGAIVVGEAFSSTAFAWEAARWDENNQMERLGHFPPDPYLSGSPIVDSESRAASGMSMATNKRKREREVIFAI